MNNTSVLKTTHKQDLFSSYITVILNTLYATITAAGVLVNSTTIIVFWRETILRRPFNLLLLNLFVADMMFSLTMQSYIWIDFTKIPQQGRMAGFMCVISVGLALPMVCMTANSLSLVAITLLRYLTIVHNINNSFTTSITFTKAFCAFTWLAGIAVAIPSIGSYKYDHEGAICYRDWPKGVNGQVYSAVTTTMFFGATLLVMIIAYALLALNIWVNSLKSSLRNGVAERAKKSITILLGLLILAVIVCWTPLFLVWFLGRTFDCFPKGVDGEFKRQRWLRISLIVGIINPVLDPIIYAYSCSEYRTGLCKLFRHCKRNRVQVTPDRRNQEIPAQV